MAEYIDRDAAIALAKDIIVPTKSGYDYRHRCIDPQDLAELPAADVVERKTGKWIPIKGETGVEAFGFQENTVIAFFCSNCEEDVDVSGGDFNFCPHCGAKMEVPADV